MKAFSVLDAVVSDHAPLYLEFSVALSRQEKEDRQAIRDASAWLSTV